MGIDALGYEEDQKALYLEALHKPQGMFLVTGPTGSAKLFRSIPLNILNTDSTNISTAEDPVEINLRVLTNVQSITVLVWISVKLYARSYDRTQISSWSEKFEIWRPLISLLKLHKQAIWSCPLCIQTAPETLTRLRNMIGV